jgi:hypothetical protein
LKGNHSSRGATLSQVFGFNDLLGSSILAKRRDNLLLSSRPFWAKFHGLGVGLNERSSSLCHAAGSSSALFQQAMGLTL